MKIHYIYTRLAAATFLIFTSGTVTAMQVDETGKLGDPKVWNPADLATQVENFRNFDLSAFAGYISFVHNTQNVKSILLAFINQPADQLSTEKIGRLILEFDKPNRAMVTFDATDGDILAALDKNHTKKYIFDGTITADNEYLSGWKEWFKSRGVKQHTPKAPAPAPAASTTTQPVQQQNLTLWQQYILDHSPEFYDASARESLATILLLGDTGEDFLPIIRSGLSLETLQKFRDTLTNKRDYFFNQGMTNQNYNAKGNSLDAAIQAQNVRPQPMGHAATRFALNRTHALLTAAATTLGLYAAYRWFTKAAEAENDQDLLINKTGSDVFFRMDNNNPSSTLTVETDLPQAGTITVVTTNAPDAKKLFDIPLDRYTQAREDNYLTITIRPAHWYEKWWYKTPIYYSVNWKQKNPVEQKEKP